MLLSEAKSEWVTVADLLKKLGNVPPERVHLDPPPGTATEKDLLEAERRTGRTCELVDGVLVEKAIGVEESFWALRIAFFLQLYLEQHKLGFLAGGQTALCASGPV